MGEPRYFVEPDDDAESPYAALVIDRDGTSPRARPHRRRGRSVLTEPRDSS